jgi:hypothetical protein
MIAMTISVIITSAIYRHFTPATLVSAPKSGGGNAAKHQTGLYDGTRDAFGRIRS